MNGMVPPSFPPESPAPRRSSRRVLLIAAAVILLLAVAGGLLFWQQKQAAKEDITSRLAAARQAAIAAIKTDWDIYGVCSDDNGADTPCQTWLVDASVTKNGTITIVSITGSSEQHVPNDGVVTEEALTDTLNISHMVILQEELSIESAGT